MCGIIGYIGKNNSIPYLIDGLERLEYRGYDSAGIAVIEEDKIACIKAKGKIENLKRKINTGKIYGGVGIGHTRWATHGKPSDENSHPHLSEHGLFAVVHNGIIENYGILKEHLIKEGVLFSSETDTEVISQLLEKEYNGDFLNTVKRVTDRLEGSFALSILCRDFPDEIICMRKQSPLVVGKCEIGVFAASDITAILKYTNEIYKLNDGEFVRLTKDSVQFFCPDLKANIKSTEKIDCNISKVEKGGFEHFMLKEIYEQPQVLRATLNSYIKKDRIVLEKSGFSKEYLNSLRQIYIVACGSAYHVGMLGKYVIEKLTGIPTQTDIASEYRYREPIIDKNTLVIAVTQSGETADTLAAIRLSKEKGAKVLSIVNVVSSTASNESDHVLYTRAGPEISVATTKAYSSQLIMMYILSVYIALETNKINENYAQKLLSDIKSIPDSIEKVIQKCADIERIAEFFKNTEHAYFIGRNIDYAAALEASLKMKEISYLHCEAYGAGELKHGTISLIEKDTPVVALCGYDKVFAKTLSNIKEVKARGAKVICVLPEKHKHDVPDADFSIIIPDTAALFIGSVEIVPMQLLSYFTAKKRGCDIDKPRNLAKSVTVE